MYELVIPYIAIRGLLTKGNDFYLPPILVYLAWCVLINHHITFTDTEYLKGLVICNSFWMSVKIILSLRTKLSSKIWHTDVIDATDPRFTTEISSTVNMIYDILFLVEGKYNIGPSQFVQFSTTSCSSTVSDVSGLPLFFSCPAGTTVLTSDLLFSIHYDGPNQLVCRCCDMSKQHAVHELDTE